MESHWIYKIIEEISDKGTGSLGYRFGRISDKECRIYILCNCPTPHKTPEEARNCKEACDAYEREVALL